MSDTIQEESLYCAVHTETEAYLRCIRCDRLMCTECTVRTSVGYICKECARKSEDRFFAGTQRDYLISFGIVCAGSTLVNGLLFLLPIGGFFGWFIAAIAGGAAGSFIGNLARRATERRVGRYSPQIMIGATTIGLLLSPTLFILLRFGMLALAPQVAFNFVNIICTIFIAMSVYNIFMRRI